MVVFGGNPESPTHQDAFPTIISFRMFPGLSLTAKSLREAPEAKDIWKSLFDRGLNLASIFRFCGVTKFEASRREG
jgi:hypothetical protein